MNNNLKKIQDCQALEEVTLVLRLSDVQIKKTNTNVDYLINGATLCQKNKSGNWATCFDVGARLNIQVVYN